MFTTCILIQKKINVSDLVHHAYPLREHENIYRTIKSKKNPEKTDKQI